MKLSDFDYNLPEELIADRPPEIRGTTRLLCLDKNSGQLENKLYSELNELLKPSDLLIINNTRVVPARLRAATQDGGKRELLILEKHGNTDSPNDAYVMYRRKLHAGQKLIVEGSEEITVEETFGNGTARISSTKNIWDFIEDKGAIPLPPYMHREADESDKTRYQTVFAKEKGSVAAPTASLNVTDELMAKIRNNGTKIEEITLHVGLGTFMPIRTDNVEEHEMHSEYFEIPSSTVEAIRKTKQQGGKIIALGTTVTRTLEYSAEKILDSQPFEALAGEANIFIYPGYQFKLVDAMITNFHAPHSTVLMMAAAFAGWDNLKNAYEHAVFEKYQFLSYGDSMFIA